MATIRTRRTLAGASRYHVVVRKTGQVPVSATFSSLRDARRWASETELELERGRFWECFEASRHTLAIGDGVNLAARLEGVNKLYGTGILLSGETFARLDGSIPMRLVDRVIVKGKSKPVEIYTPSADLVVNELSARAIGAYRLQRWEQSEILWREILKRHPDDGIAALYLERIETMREVAPEPDWAGATELEKL